MDKKTRSLLLCLACFSALGAFLSVRFGGEGTILYLLSLPFVGLGKGLRYLSLSGSAGNLAALLLYAVCCLFPILPGFLRLRRKEAWQGAEWAGLLTAAYCLFALYYFVNPQLMDSFFPMGLGKTAGTYALSLCFYSFFLLQMLLVFLRRGSGMLYKSLRSLLYLLFCVYVLQLFYVCFYSFLQPVLETLKTDNGIRVEGDLSGFGKLALMEALGYSGSGGGIFLYFLRFLLQGLPILLLLRLFNTGFQLLQGLELISYSNENALLAEKLAVQAKQQLIVSVLCSAIWNFLQLFNAEILQNIDLQLNIPLIGMLLALLCFTVSRHYAESCRIYQENQEFV